MARSPRRSPGTKRRRWWLTIPLAAIVVGAWTFVIEPRLAQVGFVSPGDCVVRSAPRSPTDPEQLRTSACDATELTYHVVSVNSSASVDRGQCPTPEVGWFRKDNLSQDTDPDSTYPFACLAPNFVVDHCYRAAAGGTDAGDAVISGLTDLHGEASCDERGSGFFRVAAAHPSAGVPCRGGEIALSYPTPGRTYCVVPQPAT